MAFPLRLDPDLDAALTAHAERTGVPKVVTVRRALERELGLDPENRVRTALEEERREVAGRGGHGRGETPGVGSASVETSPQAERLEPASPPRAATSSPKRFVKPDFKKGM